MKPRVKEGLRDKKNRHLWNRLQRARGMKNLEEKRKPRWSFEVLLELAVPASVFLYLFHLILRMNEWTTLAIAITFLFFLPAYRKQMEKKKMQETRVQDLALYMDTMLYAFLKEGKIEAALSDVAMALGEGSMKEQVHKALAHMHLTFDDTEVIRDSLAIIEKEYPSRRLQNIHSFMIHEENYGGEIHKPVELLLMDKEMWELRMKEAMQSRSKMFRDVVLSIVMSLVICGVVQHIPIMNVDISANSISQIGTFLVFLLDEFILLRGFHLVAQDWIAYDETNEDAYYERKLREYNQLDMKKERRKSILCGSVAGVIAVAFFRIGRVWFGAGALLVMVFMLYQHKIGQWVAKRQLEKEVKRAFPNWLMDLVLLLQSENVQVALQKSNRHVPGVLKMDLKLLIDRLEVNPEDAMPYHQFLQQFKIPEVQSAMSMLYSMSAGHGGNSDSQIGDLIARNQKMLDNTEKQKTIDRGAGLYLLFLAPVMTASLKMLVDMSVFMLTFLSSAMG